MKIGIGLYRHMLTRDYYDFARQAGCTHVVVHLVDYFNQGPVQPAGQSAHRLKIRTLGICRRSSPDLDGKAIEDSSR